MFPRSHRRDLIEALLGNQGNLISLSKLADILQTDRKIIKDRLRWLIGKGAVVETRRYPSPRSLDRSGPNRWEVIYSINHLKLMELLRKPTRKTYYTGWDRMWRVIRAYKRFNRRDLCQLASVSEGNAKCFTKALRKMGYIREAKGVWEIIRDPGPDRPIPLAK